MEKSELKISVGELRRLTSAILDRFEKDSDTSEFTIKENFYWEIAEDARYSLDIPPETFEVGSLRDDWHFLAPLLEKPDQASPLMLIHLAPIFRYLARQSGDGK